MARSFRQNPHDRRQTLPQPSHLCRHWRLPRPLQQVNIKLILPSPFFDKLFFQPREKMTINLNIMNPIAKQIPKLAGPKQSFLTREVASRAAHAAFAPFTFLANCLDTGLGLLALGTLGFHQQTTLFADRQLCISKYLISSLYWQALNVLNPHVVVTRSGIVTRSGMIAFEGDGLLHERVVCLKNKASNMARSTDFSGIVGSRTLHLLYGVASVVTRLADAAIAVPAIPLSLVTLGKIESLNNLARRSAQATGLIKDISFCIIHMVDPAYKERC